MIPVLFSLVRLTFLGFFFYLLLTFAAESVHYLFTGPSLTLRIRSAAILTAITLIILALAIL